MITIVILKVENMKKIVFILLFAFVTIASMAQDIEYQTVAKSVRNMQTQQYGPAISSNAKIVRHGNSSVNIGGKLYNVISVDEDIRTDSLVSTQFTASDEAGKEYIVKFLHDSWAKVELMKNFVVIFETAHPYDWTYYFCTEPKQ